MQVYKLQDDDAFLVVFGLALGTCAFPGTVTGERMNILANMLTPRIEPEAMQRMVNLVAKEFRLAPEIIEQLRRQMAQYYKDNPPLKGGD